MGDAGGGQRFRAGPQHSNVQAFVRLRPPSDKCEIELFEISVRRPGVITLKDPLSSGRVMHSFEFTGVLSEEDDQERTFAKVTNQVVDGALAGENGCVMAYGQTGSGKTYSIFGLGQSEERGILPRALEQLLTKAAAGVVVVSFLEVHMDQILDLACDSDAGAVLNDSRYESNAKNGGLSSATLELHEDSDGNVFVKGLTLRTISTISELWRLLDHGLSRRATAATAMNVVSSRSHTIFTAYVLPTADATNPEPASAFRATRRNSLITNKTPSISFVDLAGSERLAKSRAEGTNFLEAVAINSSLTAFGKVVLALASKSQHVPYRDSKLTRLLSPSLGGNARLALLATLHPRVEEYEECLRTLSFADRCKNVAHQPQVHYISADKNCQNRICDLQSEAKALRTLLLDRQPDATPRYDFDPTKQELNEVAALSKFAFEEEPGVTDEIDKAIEAAIKSQQKGTTHSRPVGPQGADEVPDVVHKSTVRFEPRIQLDDAEEKNEGKSLSPHVSELIRIQEARQLEVRKRERIMQRLLSLDADRTLIQETDASRNEEIAKLEMKKQELKERLVVLQEKLECSRKEALTQHENLMEQRKSAADCDLKTASVPILKIQSVVNASHEAAAKRCQIISVGTGTLQEERLADVAHLQEVHIQRHGFQKGRWDSNINEAKRYRVQLESDFEAQRSRCLQEVSQSHNEYLVFCSKIHGLLKTVFDAEGGEFPVLRRDGMAQAIIPESALPSEARQENFPRLFDAINREKPSGTTCACGGTASVTDSVSQSKAENVVDQLCRIEDQSEAERFLRHVDPMLLSRVCGSLRTRSWQVCAPEGERELLRKEGLAGLEDEATTRYAQNLQERRNACRIALTRTLEQQKRMLKELGHFQPVPATPSTRPGSRLSSRPTTATTSRPTTATRSRPATATTSRPSSRVGTKTSSRPATATSVRRPMSACGRLGM